MNINPKDFESLFKPHIHCMPRSPDGKLPPSDKMYTLSCCQTPCCPWPKSGGVLGKMIWLCGCTYKQHEDHKTVLLSAKGPGAAPFPLWGPIIGPDCAVVLLTNGIIIITCVAFLGVIAPSLPIGVAIAEVCLTLAVLLAFGATTCRNPGIIPRQTKEQLQALRELAEEQGVTLSGSVCNKCNVYRPPQARHCGDCDVCFLELDHHCPVMGTCVAKNTLYSFYAFNIMWPILMVYTGVSTAVFVGLQLYFFVSDYLNDGHDSGSNNSINTTNITNSTTPNSVNLSP